MKLEKYIISSVLNAQSSYDHTSLLATGIATVVIPQYKSSYDHEI
jgi:hypothetical protein